MTSCCSDASRRQTDSAIKPSRHPLVPLQASGPAAACPARPLCPTCQRFWKTASSQSTRLSSRRSSPASKRPKRTSAKTDVQPGTVTSRPLVNDCIIHNSGTWSLHSFVSVKVFDEGGSSAIEISRGCRCNKHTQSLCVLDTLQSSYLLSC